MGTILTKPVSSTFFLFIGLLALTKLLNPTLYSSITTPSNLVLPLTFSLIALSLILPLFKKSNLPPGPPSLPIFGNWLQVGSDLNHRFLASMSRKHGPIFLLKLGAVNMVVVSDPKLADEVLHTQGVEFGSRPQNVVFDIFTDKGQDMVFSVYGDHWRKMRRVMTVPFFTNKVVQQYRGMWEEEMDLVLKDLYRDERASVEGVVIRRRLQLMQYNILYRMMFDTRFESMEDPLFKQVTQFNTARTMLAQSFEYNYGEFMPILRPFLRGYLERCRELQNRRLAFFNNHFIEKRRKVRAVNGHKHDISCAIDYILEAERTGEINEKNVIYIVENLNVAAIETTLWSMEWAIAELVNHPHIQNKLRDEILTILEGSPLTESDLHRLPYLQAVLKETLRLHTPVPLLVPHMNLEEAKLNGYTIPKGSKVVVNAWWLANNPEWWKKPEEFRPERFLEEEGGIDAVIGGRADFRYLPFGVGRRSCPGIILALPIIGIAIGKLVMNFELRPPEGVEKIDVTERGGQFSLLLANHSTVVFRQLKARSN